jgi:glutamate synthase (NADPH) large chain
MSKMGISAVSSYHGAQIFEALGIGDEVVDQCFTGTTSRIGGIGFEEIAARTCTTGTRSRSPRPRSWRTVAGTSTAATATTTRTPPQCGAPCTRSRRAPTRGERRAVRDAYREYLDVLEDAPVGRSATCCASTSDREPIDVSEVEPVEKITARFVTGAMSLGALSPEAHEDIARAMNRLGGAFEHGRGWRGPAALHVRRRQARRQLEDQAGGVGRFGVTPAYLAGCRGAGDQDLAGLQARRGRPAPGHEGEPLHRAAAHVMPGTPLISPPPHHDIYSIEDIAQLIYDLKTVNPRAKVCVKLVSSEGVGVDRGRCREGVRGHHPDLRCRGRHGRLAALLVKYAGSPWELGLAETQQALVMNSLRGRVTLRSDGGYRSGRDVCRCDARCGAVRLRHGGDDRRRLQDGASVPPEHLPGRRRHPARGPAREVLRHAGDAGHLPHARREAGA